MSGEPTEFTEKLGIHIDPELLILALTHRSFSYENGGIPTNERLEFLGDAVLGIIVTEALYKRYPEHSEGELAKFRAGIVSQRALAQTARRIDLGNYLLLGRGEILSEGKNKDSILSDGMEALIGAVYLSAGVEKTRDFVLELLADDIETIQTRRSAIDWKTELQELVARELKDEVRYQSSSTGPDHARWFTAEVWVSKTRYGVGEGTSRKHAEQQAAERAHQNVLDGLPHPETETTADVAPVSKTAKVTQTLPETTDNA